MMKSNGMEASLRECYLTDGVAGGGEDIQRLFQPLLVFRRQVKFADNGQLHHTNYTPRTRICQEWGDWRHSSWRCHLAGDTLFGKAHIRFHQLNPDVAAVVANACDRRCARTHKRV